MKRDEATIRADVEMGLMLHAILEHAKTSLEGVSERLRADALARPEEHKPLVEDAREGMQWTAPGGLKVVLTADKLVSQFEDAGKIDMKVTALMKDYVDATLPGATFAQRQDAFYKLRGELLKSWTGWERAESDGLAFRALVDAKFSGQPTLAELFIDALKLRDKDGNPKSDVKTEWSDLQKTRAMEKATADATKLMKRLAKTGKQAAKAGTEAA